MLHSDLPQIFDLPLSWVRRRSSPPHYTQVKLPLSGLTFVAIGEVPYHWNLEALYRDMDSKFPKGFLLRGCNSDIAKYLLKKGFEVTRTGAEALINLGDLYRISKSVRELVHRGLRWGRVKEISFSEFESGGMSEFLKLTSHAAKPGLKHLFRSGFDENTRCFVLRTHEDECLGMITLSVNGTDSVHTEMILRRKDAPVGIMEAVIISVCEILKDQGYKYLSLGEVPFVTPPGMADDFISNSVSKYLKEGLFFKAGHTLSYAYNYRSLFAFKNKFNPQWKSLYICAKPGLSYLAFADLFNKTGYFNLSKSQVSLKKLSSILSVKI